MDTAAPSGSPSAPVTPAAPAASSSTVQKDFNSRVTEAKTPADIRRLTQEMVASSPKPGSQPKPAVQAPAPEPAAVEATPAAEPEPTTPETSEETPAADAPAPEQTEPEATLAADAEPEAEDDGGDGPVTPVSGKRAHLRLAEDDQVGRLAAALMKRNRDLPMREAVAKAEAQLGIKPAAAPAASPETPAEPTLPATPEEVQTVIAQQLVAYKKAMSEVRFEDAADIQAKILELQGHRTTLERRAEQEQVKAAQKYDADFDASLAKAVDLYPFATDQASSGFKRMAQIDAVLKQNGDPLYHRADKPLKLAQMVAAELNIAPRNKNAAPAKPAAAPVANGAPKKGVVPSGGARTTPPATNQPAVDPGVAGIKNMTDLRAQLKRFGVRA